MPEMPDLELYLACIRRVAVGHSLVAMRTFNPFVVRSVTPSVSSLAGRDLLGVSRIGKRLVFEFSDDLFVVIHLMVSGRWRWITGVAKPFKIAHAAFQFEEGALVLTEASSKKRASITVVAGRAALKDFDRGGLEVTSNFDDFEVQLRSQNRTLKRALIDPTIFSGIGNAYSDEILHDARLSPLRLSHSLSGDEARRLHQSVLVVIKFWTDKLLVEFATKFPGAGDVTAFRPDFSVHGKFGQPCPVCGSKVQRIVYADNETNYCAKCQNEGRLLADRALSRLLKSDWPKSLDEVGE